jgi:hypothetical protein
MMFREFNICDAVDWERKSVIWNIMLGRKGTLEEEERFSLSQFCTDILT